MVEDLRPAPNPGSGPTRALVRTVSSVFPVSLVIGCMLAYSSPATVTINLLRNPFHLSTEEQSWVGSSLSLGGVVGSLIGGLFMDRYGRHCAMVCFVALFAVSWVALAASVDALALVLARAGTGVFGTILFVDVTVYLSEVAPSATRGTALACHALSMNVGGVLINASGSVLPWTWLAVLCAAILTAAAPFLALLPETPHWLLAHGHAEAAARVLARFRRPEDVDGELDDIRRKWHESRNGAGLRALLDRRVYKPLLLCSVLWVVQVFSGVDFVMFYTVTIFAASRNGMDPFVQTIVVGAVSSVTNFLSIFAMDRFGRRACLLASTATSAFSMAATGLYYRLKQSDAQLADESLYWLPLAALVFFQVAYSVGLATVPGALTAELLPNRARGVGTSVAVIFMLMFMFVESKFALSLTETWIRVYGVFWIFGAILALGAVFVYFFIPETKGKTLEAIEELFA